MSIVDDQILEANIQNLAARKDAALEHLAELERNRVASEAAVQDSAKSAWEKRRAKWKVNKTPKVLQRLPLPVQLNQN
jgi:hypothetical protein